MVEDRLRWNANNPQSKTMIPYSRIDEMDEATTLFSKNRNKRLDHFADTYRGQFDAEAMHTIISDHGDPNDETHMRSMCMHPKYTEGAQTCASIIAMPRQKRFRIYETNPCLNKMKVYRF